MGMATGGASPSLGGVTDEAPRLDGSATVVVTSRGRGGRERRGRSHGEACAVKAFHLPRCLHVSARYRLKRLPRRSTDKARIFVILEEVRESWLGVPFPQGCRAAEANLLRQYGQSGSYADVGLGARERGGPESQPNGCAHQHLAFAFHF